MEFLKDLAASLRRARTVELPDGNSKILSIIIDY
jgi:hypothetical protein